MTRTGAGGGAPVATAGAVVLPLALAQFIASYAASNMNVAISTIAADLDTDVTGIQTTITLFTLTMAALMIPGSKLTDIWGRKFCFILGLIIYGAGALLAALAQGLGLLIIGYSLLEGVGSALMIPPIYILITVVFDDLKTRAKWFGVVSGAAGLGAAAGPLIGGLITSYVSWRASFLLQVAGRRRDRAPRPTDRRPAAGRRATVASTCWAPSCRPPGSSSSCSGSCRPAPTAGRARGCGSSSPVGVVVLAGFFLLRAGPRAWRPDAAGVRRACSATGRRTWACSPRTSSGSSCRASFFVISVFLQQERGYSAIQTGLMLVPATIGILLSVRRWRSGWPAGTPSGCWSAPASPSPWSASSCCCSSPGRTPRTGPSGPACSSWASASAPC